jgi:hypothetical protein
LERFIRHTMIKLIDLLNEGKQVGILYHYTENWLLKQIIETDTLLAPVSFTRRQSNWVRDFTNGESIIVVDGDKLSNNYKIRPYQDINPFLDDIDDESPSFEGGKNEEYEERVDRNITDLNKYILKIIFLVPDSEIESLLKEKNIPYEIIK